MNNSNNNQQQNNNEFYTPTTHSAYRFFNSNSKVDNTAMSFAFWNSLLKITMNPIITQEGSANKVDTNNNVTIYLSPARAQLLLHCIRQFRANPDMYDNLGVPTKKGVILICNGRKMYNVDGTFITINLISDSGEVEARAAYEINSDLYGISNYTNGSSFDKYTDYSSSLELDMMETLLEQFVSAYTNAVAASVIDCNKTSDNRMFNFIKDVREKLGISTKSNDSSSKYGKSSWFSNGSSSSSSSDPKVDKAEYSAVMSEIESLMS